MKVIRGIFIFSISLILLGCGHNDPFKGEQGEASDSSSYAQIDKKLFVLDFQDVLLVKPGEEVVLGVKGRNLSFWKDLEMDFFVKGVEALPGEPRVEILDSDKAQLRWSVPSLKELALKLSSTQEYNLSWHWNVQDKFYRGGTQRDLKIVVLFPTGIIQPKISQCVQTPSLDEKRAMSRGPDVDDSISLVCDIEVQNFVNNEEPKVHVDWDTHTYSSRSISFKHKEKLISLGQDSNDPNLWKFQYKLNITDMKTRTEDANFFVHIWAEGGGYFSQIISIGSSRIIIKKRIYEAKTSWKENAKPSEPLLLSSGVYEKKFLVYIKDVSERTPTWSFDRRESKCPAGAVCTCRKDKPGYFNDYMERWGFICTLKTFRKREAYRGLVKFVFNAKLLSSGTEDQYVLDRYIDIIASKKESP